MRKVFITQSSKQTQKLGELLAQELQCGPASPSLGREIICLTGELGSGKTTFTQGLLCGLKIEAPYTSPTFVVIKEYKPHPSPLLIKEREYRKAKNIYHIDAYRITEEDILNLGWEEIISDRNNIVIVEWADRIRKIIPRNALWINFSWVNKNRRRISLK